MGNELPQKTFRPPPDWVFHKIAGLIALRGTCTRAQVGTIATIQRRIVSTGFNGSPPGAPHCEVVGCELLDDHPEAGCQRAIHAEANCVAFAARAGVSLEGATIYSTHSPCLKCAQLLVVSGIATFRYVYTYRLERNDVLMDAGVMVINDAIYQEEEA